MRDRIFFAICFGFVFGVLLRSFLLVNVHLVVVFGIIACALILFFTLVSPRRMGILISVLLLGFSLGILRFNAADVPAPKILEAKIGAEVTLQGEIVDEPNIGESNQKLIVLITSDKNDTNSAMAEFVSTKILISTSLDTDYKYGDEINFSGNLEHPENFITDQGKEFDYINYLRKDGIYYVMSYVTPEIISRAQGNFIRQTLFDFKEKFLEKINLSVRSPESLLLGGLLLGERAAFSDELRQKFIDTGTIHIVALSGYNITIVAEWFMKLFSFLPRNLGIGAGILAIALFVLMTGASSTAIRAGIMAVLALIARATGRNYDVARALLLAGVIMILLNPFLLVFDVSFQLSFLATFAVIFLTPKVEKYFLWVTKSFGLRDIFSVTFAVYIFVLPFILYKMGNLSLVALPANILVLPLIPFTMILGFIAGFGGLLSYIFAAPLGFLAYLLLHYELAIISFFSSVPFAALTIPNFPLVLALLIYASFMYKLFWRNLKDFLVSS
jgi:competence protein ComEC